MSVVIIKADGTAEPFNSDKLLASLQKAGASVVSAKQIVTEVERSLIPNTRTSEIYRKAFALLRKREPRGTAARYSLRRALLEFGPSGFPFELYLAELFRKNGFEATTNCIIAGKCVEHEIDVLLTKDGVHTYVEAKFHNTPGFKTDLKVSLYVAARIEDIRSKDATARGMIVTNTKLTSKAFAYAHCAGLEVLTWDYPQNASLQILIEKAQLYPVTALATLSKREKEALVGEKIVLCNAVTQHTDFLRTLGLKEQRMQSLFEEIGALCG